MKITGLRKVSTYLILLGSLLFIISSVVLVLAYQIIQDLEHDASIINRAGTIRGSIQRLTKLELEMCEKPFCDTLIDSIDSLQYEMFLTGEEYISRPSDQKFDDALHLLHGEWIQLKNLILEYRESPTSSLKLAIIRQSEQCWKTADLAVLTAQIISERKVQNIRLITYLVIAIIINTIMIIWLIYQNVRKKLEYRAAYDGMTGLMNKSSYLTDIEREISRSGRYSRDLALIVFDIDFFKRINDTFGHRMGDKTLTQLANLVKASVRRSDMVYRIGGEEFAVISPETGLDGARQVAEKLCWDVENYSFPRIGQVTISLGVAISQEQDNAKTLFQRADKALYLAKNRGRNRVEVLHDR